MSESVRRNERLPDLLGALPVATGAGVVRVVGNPGTDLGMDCRTDRGCRGRRGVLGGGGSVAVAASPSSGGRDVAVADLALRYRQRGIGPDGGAVYAWMLLAVLFLTGVWRYSEMQAGLAMTPGAITAAITAALLGRRLERGGQRAAVVGGSLLLSAVGFWLATVLGPEPRFLTIWLPAGLLCGAAMGAMGVGISTAAATAVGAERYAAATGLNLTARQVGGALGVAVLAAILQAGLPHGGIHPYLHVFVVCSCCSLGAAGVAVRLGVRRSRNVSWAHFLAQLKPTRCRAARLGR